MRASEKFRKKLSETTVIMVERNIELNQDLFWTAEMESIVLIARGCNPNARQSVSVVHYAASMQDLELIYKKIWDHYNQIAQFTREEFDQIVALSTIETLKKGELLFKQGTIPRYGGYIIRGAVRYFHTDRGKETTTGFQFEDDCFGDMRSILFNEPAKLSLQAMEETTIGRLNKEHYRYLFDHCKPFAKVMLLALEKSYNDLLGATIERIGWEAEDRYVKMLNQSPLILQRVSQRHIASYLGIKPQSLSRIRKNIMQRPITALQLSA